MSIIKYTTLRQKILGTNLFETLAEGEAVPENLLQYRFKQLQLGGFNVNSFDDFIESIGLGNVPSNMTTSSLIEKRIRMMEDMMRTSDADEILEDLEELEFE